MVTLLALTCHSAIAISLRENDVAMYLANVVSVTIDIEARALVDVDERCGFIIHICLKRSTKIKKAEIKVEIVS